MTKQQLREELKLAMLAKNALKTSVLRMLISAVGYYEIQKAGTSYEATNEEIISVIQKEVKQHRDSIEQFRNGGRQDLVEKETKELEILISYLPAQMSEDEVKMIVNETIEQTGAKTMADMGKVMGVLMPKVKGKSDSGLVSRLVKEKLAG